MAVNNDLYQQAYRDIALERVRKNGLELKHIDKKSLYYEQIVRAAIAQNPLAIKHVKVSEPFYNELAALVVNANPSLIKHIDKKATNYATLAAGAVSKDVKLLKKIDKKNEAYKSLAYSVATQDPSAKKYVQDKSVKQVIKLDGMDKSKKAKKYDKLAQKAVKTNLEALKHVNLGTTKEELLDKSIKKNQGQLAYVSMDAALSLIRHDRNLYDDISPAYKKDKEFMTDVVKKVSFFDYSKIDNSLLDNEEFLRGVANSYPSVMEHASDRLKDNKEFMLDMVKDTDPDYKYEIARYASERLLDQKDFVSKTGTLSFASDKLRSDRKYVLDYMEKRSKLMYVASESLRNDKDFVLHCINNTKYGAQNFEYASNELKNNKEVVLAALENNKIPKGNYSVAFDMGKELKADREFMLEIMKEYNVSAYNASNELREDKEFMKEAITLNGHNFNSIGENLNDDKELALLAIANDGATAVMQNMGKKLKKDKEVFKAAAKSNIDSLEYADKKMLKDKKLMLSLIGEVSPRITRYIDSSLLNDKKFMLEAIEKDRSFYYEINKNLREDKKFMAKASEIYDRKIEEEQAKIEQEKQQKELKEEQPEKKASKKKKTTEKKKTTTDEKTEVPLQAQEVKEEVTQVEENKEVIENKESKEEVKIEAKEETKAEATIETKKRASTKAMGSYDALSDENKAIYDKIMKKSFTNVFKAMTKEQETYLKGIYKEAYDKVKVKDPKEYTPEDVQVIALLTKITKKKVQAQGTVSKSNDEIKKMMDDKVKEKKATSSSR